MQRIPLKSALADLLQAVQPLEGEMLAANAAHFGQTRKIVLFASASNIEKRATCACGTGISLQTAWKAAIGKLRSLLRDENDWRWVKIDLVHSIRPCLAEELVAEIAATRRNHFRRGIAFDRDFNLALLEQELNGIGGIGFDDARRLILRFDRINRHLKSSRKLPALSPAVVTRDTWYTFQTTAFFVDTTAPGSVVRRLISGGYGQGIRAVPVARDDLPGLIDTAGRYLAAQLRPDGSFAYGYFPVGQVPIDTYNILRHSSSLYAMLEASEATGNAAIAAGVAGGIDYVLREALARDGDRAVVVDHANKGEVKLGAQAALILLISKHMKLTGDARYLDTARAVAASIVERFLDPVSGRLVHVLHGEDLTLKDAFRIIFYDGEAVLALLRLYELDGNARWLEMARLAFESFIRRDRWRHSDHWLAYCTNEITQHVPDDRYFEFGLKNAFCNLDFIHNRDTAYPTFLELLMATFRMMERMESLGKPISEPGGRARLADTIAHRAEHLRYSHFYPEMAMYFRRPAAITGSFFIRHHGFRIRIDDIEHFISGYCLYLDAVARGKL